MSGVLKKKTLFIFLMAALILAVLEIFSGIAIFTAHKILGSPKRISLFRFHPLLTSENILEYEKNWSETFPVYGYTNRIFVSDECGFTTDAHGFIHNGDKGRVITPEKFSIFLVGGSTVAGHGSTCNDQTISAHLEKLLQKDYPDVQVINAGVSGYYSPQELLKISNEIMYYDPDIVISFNGTNDFNLKYTEYGHRPNTYFVSGYHRQLYKTLEDTHSLAWSIKNLFHNLTKFTEYTYTRFLLQKGISFLQKRTVSPSKGDIVTRVKSIVRFDRLPLKYEKTQDKDFQKIIDEKVMFYTSYVRQTQALVNGLKKQYYAVLQPILYTEKRILPPLEKEALRIMEQANYATYHVDVIQCSRYFWDAAASQLKGAGVNSHNFTSVFADNDEVYSDFMHYTDHGNAVIAENLYKMLMEGQAIPLELKRNSN